MQEQSNADYFTDCNSFGGRKGGQMAPGMQHFQQATQFPPEAAGAQDMMPPAVANPYFMAGYLRYFIGKIVDVQFSLGTAGALTDVSGQLMDVGATFIVLKLIPSNFEYIADIFSVKFVTVFPLNMV